MREDWPIWIIDEIWDDDISINQQFIEDAEQKVSAKNEETQNEYDNSTARERVASWNENMLDDIKIRIEWFKRLKNDLKNTYLSLKNDIKNDVDYVNWDSEVKQIADELNSAFQDEVENLINYLSTFNENRISDLPYSATQKEIQSASTSSTPDISIADSFFNLVGYLWKE